MQIEELQKLGKENYLCPFFMMKKRAQVADIVLMPYNYIIDPEICSRLKLKIKGNIILIDEAHNIAKSAEGVFSH
jgi:Rad3-related DNA helicase